MAENTDVYHAIADPTRRKIIEILVEGDRPVNQLAASFEMTRPAISQHLRVLKVAGLVSEQKSGRERYYRLEAERLEEVAVWLGRYEKFWRNKLDRLRQLVEREMD
jgi:DNA-binding transcriptional ArsR family regulator